MSKKCEKVKLLKHQIYRFLVTENFNDVDE